MNLESVEINKFLHDETKDNLVVYEVEVDRIDDPNDNLRAQAKADGQCACRLWLIVFLANISVIIILIFLILLLLVEIGPVPPYQTYGKQCVSGKCDPSKGLVCSINGRSKTCQCPSNSWFWFNNTRCRECPPHWKINTDGTNCYFVSHIRLNFTDANWWCSERQSRLMEISDHKTFLAFQSIKDFSLIWKSFYWIGLREIGENKNIYRWITSQLTFSNWNYFCSGQPAHSYNYYFRQYDQCIGLDIQSNTSTCLRDSTCSNVAPFICELCRSS